MTAPTDAAFEALTDEYRRRLLVGLFHRGPNDGIDPTAFLDGDSVTRHENERIAMHHRHLPRLAEDDFVEWNRDAGTVSKGQNWAAIRGPVAILEERWARPTDDVGTTAVGEVDQSALD